MNEKQRVQILGAAAVLVLGVGAVKLFKKGSSDDAPVTRNERAGAAQVNTAVASHDYSAIAKAYRAIVDNDPFREHRFLKRRGEKGYTAPPDASSIASDNSSTYIPGQLTLRLTGIVVDDGGVVAFLEDRSQGKGMFVHTGDKLGDRQIAEIRTASLVLGPIPGSVAPVRTSTIEFSDKIDVKVEALLGRLKDIAIPNSNTSTGIPGTGSVPALSPEREKSVLEALREKRKKSLNQ